jgi:hypothetical protein
MRKGWSEADIYWRLSLVPVSTYIFPFKLKEKKKNQPPTAIF